MIIDIVVKLGYQDTTCVATGVKKLSVSCKLLGMSSYLGGGAHLLFAAIGQCSSGKKREAL